jgi:hypothetical protein
MRVIGGAMLAQCGHQLEAGIGMEFLGRCQLGKRGRVLGLVARTVGPGFGQCHQIPPLVSPRARTAKNGRYDYLDGLLPRHRQSLLGACPQYRRPHAFADKHTFIDVLSEKPEWIVRLLSSALILRRQQCEPYTSSTQGYASLKYAA